MAGHSCRVFENAGDCLERTSASCPCSSLEENGLLYSNCKKAALTAMPTSPAQRSKIYHYSLKTVPMLYTLKHKYP